MSTCYKSNVITFLQRAKFVPNIFMFDVVILFKLWPPLTSVIYFYFCFNFWTWSTWYKIKVFRIIYNCSHILVMSSKLNLFLYSLVKNFRTLNLFEQTPFLIDTLRRPLQDQNRGGWFCNSLNKKNVYIFIAINSESELIGEVRNHTNNAYITLPR